MSHWASFTEGILRGYEITFNEFKTALGLQDSDFNGLDQVTIYNVTTMKDGRVYPSTIKINEDVSVTTVAPNIANSAATTSFTATITVFVQCPLPDGFAVGNYSIEQVSGPGDPFYGNPYRWTPETVTLAASGPINRTFNGTYLTFTGIKFDFIVTCGTLVVPKGGAGLGCWRRWPELGRRTARTATPTIRSSPSACSTMWTVTAVYRLQIHWC